MGILRLEGPRWCGFGGNAGLLPEIRLGWLRITVASSTFAQELEESALAAKLAYKGLKALYEKTTKQRDRIIELRAECDRHEVTIGQLNLRLDELCNPPRDEHGRFRRVA
ncbi:MAG TPA: hypothetical protein PLI96_11415 [Halothiobacillus sp.]|nr:hypothetical protein [Halothiobacillus sp.]